MRYQDMTPAQHVRRILSSSVKTMRNAHKKDELIALLDIIGKGFMAQEKTLRKLVANSDGHEELSRLYNALVKDHKFEKNHTADVFGKNRMLQKENDRMKEAVGERIDHHAVEALVKEQEVSLKLSQQLQTMGEENQRLKRTVNILQMNERGDDETTEVLAQTVVDLSGLIKNLISS